MDHRTRLPDVTVADEQLFFLSNTLGSNCVFYRIRISIGPISPKPTHRRLLLTQGMTNRTEWRALGQQRETHSSTIQTPQTSMQLVEDRRCILLFELLTLLGRHGVLTMHLLAGLHLGAHSDDHAVQESFIRHCLMKHPAIVCSTSNTSEKRSLKV